MTMTRRSRKFLALSVAVAATAGIALGTSSNSFAADSAGTNTDAVVSSSTANTLTVGSEGTITTSIANPETATSAQVAADSSSSVTDSTTTSSTGGYQAFSMSDAAVTKDGKIDRATVLARAQSWVDEGVPYNQGRSKTDQNGTYREDCSGFVSMAWNLSWSRSTVTLDDRSVTTVLSSRSDLLPGDILDYPADHTILFAGWKDQAAGTFYYYAESNPTVRTNEYVGNFNSSSGKIAGWAIGDYKFLRFNNIVDTPVTIPPTTITTGTHTTPSYHDVNKDSLDDLLAVNASTGALTIYGGKGDGTFKTPTTVGSGWNGMDKVSMADFNGDGNADIVATNASNGNLYLYLGKGDGTFQAPLQIGNGWGAISKMVAGDLDGDGKADILAVNASNGNLYFYKGTGTDVASGVQIGNGWGGMTQLGMGDFNKDGKADLVAVNGSNGNLYLYSSTGTDVASGVKIGTGWASMDKFTVADINNDGIADIAATNGQTNNLYIYAGTGSGTVKSGVYVGGGWNTMNRLI
ncbi:C40 family peptidase [Streptacidiphilus rugosus]|uniref:C40 family peptidase n=1 Tax=Streptacidiphilus rugosus TaxID=405783 RepID=UPI00068D2E47|nr:VCBS repeat-containing protein [Streptacidiphilus rugosus]